MARKYGTTWAHLHLPRFKAGRADCVSVKHGNDPTVYTSMLELVDVVFCVREGGRQATLNSGVKNVHAWVTGQAVPTADVLVPFAQWREAKYNPRKAAHFYDAETLEPLTTASAACIAGNKVYYVPSSVEAPRASVVYA